DADNHVVLRFRMGLCLLGFERVQEASLVVRAGSRGVENTGTLRGESVNQSSDQTAGAAAHRRHTHNRLGLAIVYPAITYRRNQFVEVGSRRCFFAGELSGSDAVAAVSKGDDLAFQVPRGESFAHFLGQ